MQENLLIFYQANCLQICWFLLIAETISFKNFSYFFCCNLRQLKCNFKFLTKHLCKNLANIFKAGFGDIFTYFFQICLLMSGIFGRLINGSQFFIRFINIQTNQLYNFSYIQINISFKMSDIRIQINIGCYPQNPEPQHPALYENVTFRFFVKKEEIETLTKQLQQKTGKHKLPSFITELPTQFLDFRKLDLFLFSSKKKNQNDQQVTEITRGDYHYIMQDFIKQQAIFIKKIQKAFGQLTNLQNNLSASIGFYDMDTMRQRLSNKTIPAVCTITERMKIQLQLGTDPNLIDKFAELAKSISPEFANSPIIAVLPLLHCLESSIKQNYPKSSLQSFSCLEPENLKQVFGEKTYNEPIQGDQLYEGYQKCIQVKKPVYCYVTFGKLAILQVRIQARLLAMLFYGNLLK